MIQPTYVSFEQAKLLKEKGFDELCNKLYHYNGSDCIKLINKNSENLGLSAPEQWIVVEWMRVNHEIDLDVRKVRAADNSTGYVWVIFEIDALPISKKVKTPQEAYSAGIDYVLNNLI